MRSQFTGKTVEMVEGWGGGRRKDAVVGAGVGTGGGRGRGVLGAFRSTCDAR